MAISDMIEGTSGIVSQDGKINIISLTIEDTLSGQCGGAIYNLEISGNSTTSPYSVVWSGISSYSATSFNLYNLCAGEYQAVITDTTGGTGTTNILLTGQTKPSLSASLGEDGCILDPNKKCTITVSTATTTTPTYRYELVKDSRVVDIHYGSTADTTHTFTDVENGMYSVSVIEERPLNITEKPNLTGCRYDMYNDGGAYSGWNITTLFNTWNSWAPRAPRVMNFPPTYGPNTHSSESWNIDLGLGTNGYVYANNPYVWLYTGTSESRRSDNTKNWYMGASAYTISEGDNIGPSGPTASAGDVGYFYYNTFINKFLVWWFGVPGSYGWVTVDPRVNYGINGNPVSMRSLTGTTNGISNVDVDANDYTVNSAGNVALASAVVNTAPGALRKFKSSTTGNFGLYNGKVSRCSYLNYTWSTAFNSTDSDDDTISILLASFRDEDGVHGPTGVTHSLHLNMKAGSGRFSLIDNIANSAYANSYYSGNRFRDCRVSGNCATNPYYVNTILANTGSKVPITGSINWNAEGSLRTRITRRGVYGEQFKIEFTDTMGVAASATKAAGAANPYNSDYTINLNLLDKSTWTGNTISSPEWLSEDALCKYLGSTRIGFSYSSQESVNFYHMQFTGTPFESYVEVPSCGSSQGPSNSVTITATTASTLNITQTQPTLPVTSTEPGVPTIKPSVKVTMQTMPNPTLTINGINRPYVTSTDTVGGIPELNVYNSSQSGSCDIQLYFGGENDEILFGNAYPKFRVYPYLFETNEVATIPEYEVIFDSLPSYFHEDLQSTIVSASTTLPLSSFTSSAWQFIIKPSYIFKDKKSLSEYWIDTAVYPPSPNVDIKQDFYLVLVNNPPTPKLHFGDFKVPTEMSLLYTEQRQLQGLPEVTTAAYSSYTYVMTLSNKISNSGPLVYVNGLLLTDGFSGATSGAPQTGDYTFNASTRSVMFFKETVRNLDVVQLVYDAVADSYIQTVTIPASIPTSSTETIYEENGYYYINLNKQSSGGISIALNGVTQTLNKDYQQVSSRRVQLLRNTSDYVSGDTLALFYRTIYQTISSTLTKTPEIPINYTKDNNLEETIIVKMYDENGDLTQQETYNIGVEERGPIKKTCQLNPPQPGKYSYEVLVKRAYPLINRDTIYTESQSERVPFEISRSVFYTDNSFRQGGTQTFNNLY
tara:strand:- start:1508 stop:5011 length:3504 start_codon:yes stop_codon:yes gene_type:complete